jgi:predicted nucleotidyltransferase
MSELAVVLEKIKNKLSQRPEVLAVYLYGSQATGKPRLDSDIDLGVLLYPNKTYSLLDEGELNFGLAKIVAPFNVHVYIINDKSPLFRYQVIAPRKILFSKDDSQRADFEVKTFNEYFEMQPFLEEAYTASVEAARQRLNA